MGIGLVYSTCGNQWPTSTQYLLEVLPTARGILTQVDIQCRAVLQLLITPSLLLSGKAKLISACIERDWGVRGLLNELPDEPRWIVNATTYETGKNWRFMPGRMGDYILNYVADPPIPITDAIAASAAYPGLIGPLVLDTKRFEWFGFDESGREKLKASPPRLSRIHLWDGGVYDNSGIEALFKPSGRGYREGCDFLIVSDASQGLSTEKRSVFPWRLGLRLVHIMGDQARSLRARMLVSHFQQNPGCGVYLRIGNSAQKVLTDAGTSKDRVAELATNSLPESEVRKAAALKTSLRRLTCEQFDRLCRHGYEVANYTLIGRCSTFFGHREWQDW